MDNGSNPTKVIIVQPEQIEVPLVPLDKLEIAEDKYFWFTVFLAIFTCFLGLSIGAISSKGFSNDLSIYILLTTVVFGILSLIFGGQALSRKRLLKESVRPSEPSVISQDRVPESIELLIALT
jgi:hypothetical protein